MFCINSAELALRGNPVIVRCMDQSGLTRIAIIDDDPSVIARIVAVLAEEADICVASTACDIATGRDLIKQGGYDVLLCDLGLPDGSGIELIRQSTRAHPESDVIVVTIFANQSRVIDSVRAGARGYLLKDTGINDCANSIREIRGGGSPISPIIARQLLRQMLPHQEDVARPLKERLSTRESEVLNLLARGFSYAEIADLLDLTSGTVGTYVKRIYKKLEVNSRAEAVFEAGNRGIINVH